MSPTKSLLRRFSDATFGNRRLKMYLLSLMKLCVISFIQSNDLLGMTTYHLSAEELDVQFALKISSYVCMVLIPCLLTFRYVRELIAMKMKRPLTIWVNWVESIVFMLFVVYSIGTAIVHVVYLSREYKYNVKKRDHDPAYFNNKSASLEEHLAVSILEMFVQLYVILDKASHFLHANHSVSIFLAKSTPIPKPRKDEPREVYEDEDGGQFNEQTEEALLTEEHPEEEPEEEDEKTDKERAFY